MYIRPPILTNINNTVNRIMRAEPMLNPVRINVTINTVTNE